MKRLLVVLVMLATAFVFGGIAFAQNEADFPNIAKGNRVIREIEEGARAQEAQQDVGSRRVSAEQFWPGSAVVHANMAPLPALPVPPVMTEQGMVQATNPRPLDSFPVARREPIENPQQVAKPIPAIKAPPVVTEKGKVETPSPRPTQDFPVAKPQQQRPVAEIKRTKGQLDGKAVVVNQENIHVNVMLSASNNLGRKVAIEVKPGEYVLGTGTLQGWDFQPQKTKKVPNGYEVIRGREEKS